MTGVLTALATWEKMNSYISSLMYRGITPPGCKSMYTGNTIGGGGGRDDDFNRHNMAYAWLK